jgi:hypothetical protein
MENEQLQPFSPGSGPGQALNLSKGRSASSQTQGGTRAAVSAEWLPGVSETSHLRVRRIHLRRIRPARVVPRGSRLSPGHPIDPRRLLQAFRREGRPQAKRRAEPAQRFPPNGCPVFRKLRICACGGFTCGGSALRGSFPADPVFLGDIRSTPGVCSKLFEGKVGLKPNAGRNPRSGFRRMAARCFGNFAFARAADSPAADPPYEGRSPQLSSKAVPNRKPPFVVSLPRT